MAREDHAIPVGEHCQHPVILSAVRRTPKEVEVEAAARCLSRAPKSRANRALARTFFARWGRESRELECWVFSKASLTAIAFGWRSASALRIESARIGALATGGAKRRWYINPLHQHDTHAHSTLALSIVPCRNPPAWRSLPASPRPLLARLFRRLLVPGQSPNPRS